MPELRSPSLQEVTDALARSLPELAGETLSLLGDGWDFRAFAAGDYVVRVPKVDAIYSTGRRMPVLEKLQLEQRLYEALAPALPIAIPIPNVYEAGPYGRPFSVYRRVPGVMLRDLQRPAAPGFGEALGRVVHALNAFPVQLAVAIGVEVVDGPRARQARIDLYEDVVRKGFPLLSCEARAYVRDRFEAFLNDPASFAFEPRLHHGDLDDRNTLADPDTGELTGLIDFGDSHVGDSAGDFTWAMLGGLEKLGVGDEVADLLREAQVHETDIRARCEFSKFCWPLHEIIYGLNIQDEEFVRAGIEMLNDSLPHGIVCR